MSKQHVLDFILRVNDDTELQKRVRVAAMEGLSGLIKVADEVATDLRQPSSTGPASDAQSPHHPPTSYPTPI